MPRLNNGSEIYRYLDSGTAYRIPSPIVSGNTTTTAVVAAGASALTVAAITGFADGDPIMIIGDGGYELNAVKGTPTALSIPIQFKTEIAQAIGAQIVKVTAVPLGHVDENAVTVGGTQQLNPVAASTSRTPIAYIAGDFDPSVSFALRGYNNQNLQMAFGADESERGTGTLLDPYQSIVGALNVGTAPIQALRFMGRRLDGKTVMLDVNAFQISVNASAQIGAATPAAIKIDGKFGNLIQRIYT